MKKIQFSLLISILIFPVIAQDFQLVVPLGHSRRVIDLAVSSDKKWMASIDGSNEVKIWDYETGHEIYQNQGHEGQVLSLNYHNSKPILATGSSTGEVILWSERGERKLKFQLESSINGLQFSGDKLIAISGQKIVKLSMDPGGEMQSVKIEDELISLDINEHFILTGDKNGKVYQISLEELDVLKESDLSEGEISSILLQDDVALIGTNAGKLIRWDINTDEKMSAQVMAIRSQKIVSFTNQIIVCGRDLKDNLKAFDTQDLREQKLAMDFNIASDDDAFRFGLRAMRKSSDTTLLIADYNQNIREWNLKTNKWQSRAFTGLAAPVYDLSIDVSGKKLAIATGHSFIKITDLTGLEKDQTIDGFKKGVRTLDFHPVNPVLASYGMDNTIRIHNILSKEELFNLKAKGDYSTTRTAFDPTGRYILRKSTSESFDFYDFKRKVPKTLKVDDGVDFKFSPNGRLLVFKVRNGIKIFDPVAVKEKEDLNIPNLQDFDFVDDKTIVALLNDDVTLAYYDLESKTKTRDGLLTESASSDKIMYGNNSLICWKNSTKRGVPKPDFTLKYCDLSGKILSTFSGHSGFLTSIDILKDRYLLTGSTDGLIKIWDLKSKNAFKGNFISLDNQEFVITTPVGLFDASPNAMKQLHYVKDGNIVALDQLKDEFYEPKLLSKILGFNQEELRTSAALNTLSMYPELNIDHPLKNDGKLGINLDDNGGGIGRIVILINGKEVSSDVRGTNPTINQSNLEIDYNIEGHPFLYTDRVNRVTIKAYNKNGTLSSKEKSIYLFGQERSVEKPKLFAVIAGTSDYVGDGLDLKYAAKDAKDFANAIQLSASKYLGEDHVNINLMTTDLSKDQWPTKENITNAFEIISQKATAKDLLLVYISGHGVNHHGEDSDFYYLTSDASDGDVNDKSIRSNTMISSLEFTEYIKTVPALKQILVIDACHSGRLASSIASSRSAMSSIQIRALERMKDRTGTFVLAGSAADAVSYETTLYGQGLLTYSLLFGMKGAALRDNEFIDVLQLFQFAADLVPELAKEIGGIQKPEVRLPEDGKSFDIGRLEPSDQDKIKISAPKPVLVHARFQDNSAIHDHLNISDLMDQKLQERSAAVDAPFVFIDDKSFSGAITLHGRYREESGLLKAVISLEKEDSEISVFDLEAVNAQVLTDMIIKKVIAEITTGK